VHHDMNDRWFYQAQGGRSIGLLSAVTILLVFRAAPLVGHPRRILDRDRLKTCMSMAGVRRAHRSVQVQACEALLSELDQ
jgi:hypothetical protein